MQDSHILDTLKVVSYPKSVEHIIFLDECVAEPVYYRNAIVTLKTAAPSDSIEIIFNTTGGQLNSASSFITAMQECKAPILGNLSGDCMSAGTMIALQCGEWVIGSDLVFMCHTASFGVCGSSEKVKDQHDFIQKNVRDLAYRTYEGFLTESEIDRMVDSGKEHWFNAEDTSKRLDTFALHRKESYEQDMEDEFMDACNQNDAEIAILLETLDITSEDKETFNKVRRLLDETIMANENEVDVEGDETLTNDVPPNEDSYLWKDEVLIHADDYPEEPLFLEAVEYDNSLILSMDVMMDNREEVIYFLEKVTDQVVSRKKSTKTLSLQLIALATEFVLKVIK